ncbi:unnamed protein product [Paramecium sonneborni]|uniref:Uncharacterized protein n=1 Tax=Paramecium sonneborni TaxID=65129 RepID=A0A8S1RTU6_9CILI|nr:unnamed protein product [Paramecium sonneborni]CAD8130435.1 unnamed protein product [Paramecium sonneborni]
MKILEKTKFSEMDSPLIIKTRFVLQKDLQGFRSVLESESKLLFNRIQLN